MHYTIFGSTGRIGSYLNKFLISKGVKVFTPTRKDYYVPHRKLGHVIYCNGVTSDFKSKPFDTIESHICLLLFLLKETYFDSFNYISSTRINFPQKTNVRKISPDFYGEYEMDIYNASKLTGEALCIESKIPNVKVSRICHVVVPSDKRRENFLSNICGQAKRGEININTSLQSKKNYILINDLVYLLKLIGPYGKKNFYNIGSNNLISNSEILNKLVEITNCSIRIDDNAQTILEPEIDISNLIDEFEFKPSHKNIWLDNTLKKLVK